MANESEAKCFKGRIGTVVSANATEPYSVFEQVPSAISLVELSGDCSLEVALERDDRKEGCAEMISKIECARTSRQRAS
jgi:hypothetical protein